MPSISTGKISAREYHPFIFAECLYYKITKNRYGKWDEEVDKVVLISALISGMEKWKGKLALVTGASVGIGYVIAQTLVENGIKASI